MSGNQCFEILEKIFKQKNKKDISDIKGYSIKYGNIIDGENIIDEVLVSYFKAPKSYTAENMCEINSHGGVIIVRKILEVCLKNGAILAEPGEFTKRAFLNGRIDLLQAESVIDIINAKSEKEAKTGIKQLEGALSRDIRELKDKIIDVMTNIEVSIDYPEYDVEEVEDKSIENMLFEVEKKLNKLIKTFDNGRFIKEGIKTVIIGKPNAGKSSLLNAILREDRAIVTDIEGTTRDTIEEFITIEGIPLKLIDTAGIRNAKDEVERIGIEKSREMADQADLVIAIFDATKDLSDEDKEIIEIVKEKKAIIILNKNDLKIKIDENNEELKLLGNKIVKISALNKEGIEEINERIVELFNIDEINLDNDTIITNIRHKNLILKAMEDVKEAQKTLKSKMPLDIIAINIKDILEDLGKITGEEISEDIINEIFSRFCLGK